MHLTLQACKGVAMAMIPISLMKKLRLMAVPGTKIEGEAQAPRVPEREHPFWVIIRPALLRSPRQRQLVGEPAEGAGQGQAPPQPSLAEGQG